MLFQENFMKFLFSEFGNGSKPPTAASFSMPLDSHPSTPLPGKGQTNDSLKDNTTLASLDPAAPPTSAPGDGLPIEHAPLRMGLSAPSTTKDWRAKRNAVGNYGRMPRHHMGLLGSNLSSATARCFPQPMLGATMGHGLKSGDSFYFPEEELGRGGSRRGRENVMYSFPII